MEVSGTYRDKSLPPEKRAEDLVSRMTAEEVMSQLCYLSPAVDRLGIPAYVWWNEALHGVARAGTATVFPQAIGMAASMDPELLRREGEIIALEGRAKYNSALRHGGREIFRGLTYWSPNVNIFRDPRWGRGQETLGEDPFLTAELAIAFVKGLQTEKEGVMAAAACAKHFAAHSGPEAGRHDLDARPTDKDLTETYLYAFERLVREARVEGVMGAFSSLNGEPCCASPTLKKKLDEWGFAGYFTPDACGIAAMFSGKKLAGTEEEVLAAALKCSCDLDVGEFARDHLESAYRQGLLSEGDLRRACRHLLRTRIRLGMLDEKTPFDGIPYSVIACRDHRDFARFCAERSCVLLRNRGILPLAEEKLRTVAVIGPTADSRQVLLGNYNGTPDRTVTLLEGIQNRFPGRVVYAEGCRLWQRQEDVGRFAPRLLSEARSAADEADVIIACLGLDPTLEGEDGDCTNEFASGDRKTLLLPMPQRELLAELKKTGKPLIVLCTGGSGLNTEIDCDALMQVWYPGQEGGTAAARLLFGDASPSGKLPITFYETAEGLPDIRDYRMEPSPDGKRPGRTYRYTQENILYPFGYGLTYGSCEVTGLAYEKGAALVTVRNAGDRKTRDTLQLYLRSDAPYDRAFWSLCGLGQVFLAPGEEQTLSIPLRREAFVTVNDRGERELAGRSFTLWAGTHAPDGRSEALTGTACAELLLRREDL